jgi:phage N-6-adenine-methyltransferase
MNDNLLQVDIEIVNPMTQSEAERWQVKIETTGQKLGQLLYEGYKRDAWRVLGYGSWTQCVRALAEKSGFSETYGFRSIEAERLKNEVLPIGSDTKESQTRPLSKLPTDQEKVEVWSKAVETAQNGKLTAKHVESVVRSYQETGVITCLTCNEMYDRGRFIYGCPYCYKKKHGLQGWVENLPERMRDESKTSDTTRINARSNNIWYTPSDYIESARSVLDMIDLDPASSKEANEVIEARHFFTEEDNGLIQNWYGKVWLNPPYGRIASEFVAKLLDEYRNGNVQEAILLINSNTTDTNWFQPLWNYTLCFTDHRIDFCSPNNKKAQGSTHGSVFVYFGDKIKKFNQEFKQYGAIVRRVNE